MGICQSKSKKIQKPYVTRDKTNESVNATDHLPLGALLTGAKKLHDAGITGKGIVVGVIDSGIDHEHSGFNGKVTTKKWYRYGRSLTEDDHGTHVAGTIHFLAPDADIYDYRVFGATGKVNVTKAIELAIKQAVEDGCNIINMSLGGPLPSPGIEAAVKEAMSKGVLCVCAAGNEGDGDPLTNETSYPASFEECVSVAAIGKEKDLPVAKFSNSNVQVDYAGIGVDVISLKPYGGFQKMSGTSMACPHVCGFIAAILSEKKQPPVDLRKRLTTEFAMDIGAPGPDTSTGLGFVTYLDETELAGYFGKMGMKMKSKAKTASSY